MTSSLLSANIAMDALRKVTQFAATSIGNAVKSNEEYKRITDNMTVNVNALAMTLGGQLVSSLKSSLNAINDFVSKADNIKKIGASFAMIIHVGKQLITDVFDALKTALSPVIDAFKNLSKKGDELEGNMQALAFIMQFLSSGLKIVAAGARLVIQAIIDNIKVVIEATKIFQTFFDFLTGKKKWEDVKNQFAVTGEAIKNLAGNIVDNTKNVMDTAVGEFKSFNSRVEKAAKENVDIWDKAGEDSLRNFEENQARLLEEQQNKNKEKVEDTKETTEKQKEIVTTSLTSMSELYTNSGNYIANTIGKLFNNFQETFTKIKDVMMNESATGAEKALASVQGLLEGTQAIMGVVQEAMNAYYEEQLTAMQEWKEANLEEVDDWIEQEMDKQGVKEQTASERLQAQIQEKQAALKIEADATKKALLQKEINELVNEQKREKIKDEAEKKKEKIDKEAAKKEKQLKKEQFEMNKALAIVNVWLACAAGIVGVWAAGMSWPSVSVIAGVIFAGIMCHGKGTLIKLFNNGIKKVEDINENDILMGDDEAPRYIEKLYKGECDIYEVSYENFKWTCTFNHIMSFIDEDNNILNISLNKFLDSERQDLSLYKKINNEIIKIDKYRIKLIGVDNFYGFELKENNLYKLADNTITHNTGVMVTLAAAQTGIIASQQFHGAQGGIVNRGGMTGDNAVLYANKGEALFKSDTFTKMEEAFNTGNFGNNKEENSFNMGTVNLYGVNDPVVFTEQIKDIKRYEKGR